MTIIAFILMALIAYIFGVLKGSDNRKKIEENSEAELLERLASIEHDQWIVWATQVLPEVSPERQARWQKFMVPYDQLDDATKELDREWARKVRNEINTVAYERED